MISCPVRAPAGPRKCVRYTAGPRNTNCKLVYGTHAHRNHDHELPQPARSTARDTPKLQCRPNWAQKRDLSQGERSVRDTTRPHTLSASIAPRVRSGGTSRETQRRRCAEMGLSPPLAVTHGQPWAGGHDTRGPTQVHFMLYTFPFARWPQITLAVSLIQYGNHRGGAQPP